MSLIREQLRKEYGETVDLSPVTFLGRVAMQWEDLLRQVTAMSLKGYDPNNIIATYKGQTLAPASGAFVCVVKDEGTWDYRECLPVDLVAGDIVTHVRVLPTRVWAEVFNSDGKKCGGWEITHFDSSYAYGYMLDNDGNRTGEAEELLDRAEQKWCYTRHLAKASNAAPGRWNGKCQRCGKGTYTGFSSVEHDGDCR